MSNQDWNYETWKSDSSWTILDTGSLMPLDSGGTFLTGVENPIIYASSSDFGRIFIFPSNNEDYVLKKAAFDFSFIGPYSYPTEIFTKYRQTTTDPLYYELPIGQICEPQAGTFYYNQILEEIRYMGISSNLNSLQTSSGIEIQNEEVVIPHLMDKYYYMKNFAMLEVTNGIHTFYLYPRDLDNGSDIDYYTYNGYLPSEVLDKMQNKFSSPLSFDMVQDPRFGAPGSSTLSFSGITPYILLKDSAHPTELVFDLNILIQNLNVRCELDTTYCGDFNSTINIIPVDGKCDLDDNLDLLGEILTHTSIKDINTFTITDPNSDDDTDGVPFSLDLFPLITGHEILDGGDSLYIQGTCDDEGSNIWGNNPVTRFEGSSIRCDDDGMANDDYLAIADSTSCTLGSSEGSLVCGGLDYNNYGSLVSILTGLVPIYTGINRYVCVNEDSGSDKVIGYCNLEYYGPLPSEELANIEIDDTLQTLTYDDTYTVNKIEFDYVTKDAYYINEAGVKELITLPTTQDKEIIIMKNGGNIKNETIRPEYIALNAHQIALTKNKEELIDFVDKSYTLMTKLNITKELDTTTVPGKTRVKIKLEIPTGDSKNITLYQTISKTQAADYSEINFINNGGAQLIVLDKDPVIGWYFNESDGTEEIEYELPGDVEGGVIIITQEPILFNEGELVINYREGSCNADEAHLFDITDLADSNIYAPTTSFYKVCVAHLTENLAAIPGIQTLNISSYENAGLMNLSETLTNLVQISTSNSNIYWNMKIQKDNPNGNYSCLGSVNDKQNPSLFGDCGYNQDNRIWIHLGDDSESPTTDISYPYLAHTMKITVIGDDGLQGSGIDKSYYCIKDNPTDCSNNPADYTEYTKEILLTCENTWGCIKEINVFSTDNAGNTETPKTKIVTIIDEGSACAADCTAKPTPNRFLAACRNLNGCNYYQFNATGDYDDGKYVADQCNYLVEDSWAFFNISHEIKCPNGPFRQSRFTFERLYITSNMKCKNIHSIDYPVLIDGEQVKMKIIYCSDYS
ncbi:MAG: hypothetical protein PF569_06560 [Candidatus Woesearchaeota archaeon]|nr:hypothetical protein [Candidatus Woesearchaeota archaeon]